MIKAGNKEEDEIHQGLALQARPSTELCPGTVLAHPRHELQKEGTVFTATQSLPVFLVNLNTDFGFEFSQHREMTPNGTPSVPQIYAVSSARRISKDKKE